MTWLQCRLGDVIRLQRGHDLPTQDREEGEVPVVSSSGVTGYHSKAKAVAPGVVTGRYGTLGEVYYLDQDYWPLNTALYVTDFKGNDPKFAAHLLKQALGNYQSDKAAVPGVDRNVLHELPVRVPDRDTQVRIASILADYEDLIDNNRRRIKLLEDSVRLVFDEWFVYRRGVCSGLGIARSGLPVGWDVKPLADLTSKIGSGVTPRGGDASYVESGTALIRSQNVYDYAFVYDGLAFIDDGQADQMKGVEVSVGDVLINITGASVARCCMVPESILPARVNQHVMILRADPNAMDPYYLLCSLNTDANKRQLLSFAQKGATREALTKQQLEAFKIVVADPATRERFGELAQDAFRQREVLNEQIRKLRAARDLLLPRLLSGELTV